MAFNSIFGIGKAILTSTIFLGIAGFAVLSITGRDGQIVSRNQPVRLDASDDALRNGLNIIRKSRHEPVRSAASAEPVILLLNDYIYTGKPTTSTFN